MSAELIAKPSTVPSRGAMAMALVPMTPPSPAIFSTRTGRLENRRERVRHETAERVGDAAGRCGHDELDRRRRSLRKQRRSDAEPPQAPPAGGVFGGQTEARAT